MSHRLTAAETHGAHADEANRHALVKKLAEHEEAVRVRTHLRVVTPLVQDPLARAFRTPVPHRHDASVIADHMDPPGGLDSTGFGVGRRV
jgi:hypothetical protein